MSSSNSTSVAEKEKTAGAGATAVASRSRSEEGSSPVAKKPKLQGGQQQEQIMKLTDLPSESLGSIMEQLGGDFQALLGLANSDRRLQSILQQWKCFKCQDGIFVAGPPCSKKNDAMKKDGKKDKNDDTKPEFSKDTLVLSIPDQATPFLCGVCGAKLCGQDGFGKRFCTGHKCSLCGKLECFRCMRAHMEDCGACARFGTRYCQECQGGPCGDELKTCDLCRFTVCQQHGDRCTKCGIQTCGVHDFSCTRCDYCQKSYCPRCHTHGDSMWHCERCQKHSCNAVGDGAGDCPEFVFSIGKYELDWPLCPDCKQEVCADYESDDDSGIGDEDEDEESSEDGEDETDAGIFESKQEE